MVRTPQWVQSRLATQQERRRVVRTVDANARPRTVKQSDLRRRDRLGAVHTQGPVSTTSAVV